MRNLGRDVVEGQRRDQAYNSLAYSERDRNQVLVRDRSAAGQAKKTAIDPLNQTLILHRIEIPRVNARTQGLRGLKKPRLTRFERFELASIRLAVRHGFIYLSLLITIGIIIHHTDIVNGKMPSPPYVFLKFPPHRPGSIRPASPRRPRAAFRGRRRADRRNRSPSGRCARKPRARRTRASCGRNDSSSGAPRSSRRAPRSAPRRPCRRRCRSRRSDGTRRSRGPAAISSRRRTPPASRPDRGFTGRRARWTARPAADRRRP